MYNNMAAPANFVGDEYGCAMAKALGYSSPVAFL